MIVILLAALGLVLGSFANALVWRVHRQAELGEEIAGLSTAGNKAHVGKTRAGKAQAAELQRLQAEQRRWSMSRGRSMCSRCQHPLAPSDLIPLFSWLALRGKCRYCHQPIQDPPLLEAGLPLLYVVSYSVWPLSFQTGYGVAAFVVWLAVLAGFIALTLYDLRWFLLPDIIVWPLAGLAAVLVAAHATVFGGGWPVVVDAAWGVAICSGIFYVLYMVSNGRWIGGGDVKLGIVLGLLVGGPLAGCLLIFGASLLGTLASLPALLRHKLTRTSVIPFGPFLMASGLLVVLWGDQFSGWLNNLLMLY